MVSISVLGDVSGGRLFGSDNKMMYYDQIRRFQRMLDKLK